MGSKIPSESSKFLGFLLIALGLLGITAKIYTHQNDWRPGVIVKLVLIAGVLIYGVILVFKKK
jgi:hypothetical protein